MSPAADTAHQQDKGFLCLHPWDNVLREAHVTRLLISAVNTS